MQLGGSGHETRSGCIFMAGYTCSHIHSDLYLAEQLTLNSCFVSRTRCGMPAASTGCSLSNKWSLGCVPIMPDTWISLISYEDSSQDFTLRRPSSTPCAPLSASRIARPNRVARGRGSRLIDSFPSIKTANF